MIKKLRKFIVVTMASLAMLTPGFFAPALSGAASAAGIVGSLCSGSNVDSSTSGSDCGKNTDQTGESAIKSVAQKIIDAFSVIVGAVSVIMIIYGGFRYITSGGDSGKVGNAKNTLIYAIVGLVIVAQAQIIVHYVINVSSSQSGNFVSSTGG